MDADDTNTDASQTPANGPVSPDLPADDRDAILRENAALRAQNAALASIVNQMKDGLAALGGVLAQVRTR
jgi:hypothetical protein